MRQALHLALLAASNLGVTFVSQWYVVTRLGAGMTTDALFAGMTLPQLMLAVISGSLVHVLVPLLAGEDESSLERDAWTLFASLGIVFSGLAALLYVTAGWWTPLTVPGFDSAGQALTVQLTRIQLVGMVFAAVNGVQIATYHARRRFAAPEAAQLVVGLGTVAALTWVLPRYGVTGVAWVTAIRSALQTIALLPGMGRPVVPDFRSDAIRTSWKRIRPLLLGTTYYKTDPLVDRFLLSAAGSGSLSLYYLGQQLYAAATQIINNAVASPLVPQLSTLHKARNLSAFRWAYYQKLGAVTCICLVCLLALVAVGEPVLAIVIGHEKISSSDVRSLWYIMIWLGGMFLGGNAGQVCATAFYSLGDTSTPTKLSVCSFTVYLPCKVAAFHYFGVEGLAFATTGYYLANVVIQMALLHRVLSHAPSEYGYP